LTLELRLADETVVDRTALQLEWTGNGNVASSELPQRHIDAAEIALLLKNGAELMGNGDIVAARLMFQRAAEAGDARAAFALAETFDPSVLEKLGTKGAIKADIAMAQRWYAKAKDLGSTAAPERLARLTRSSQ
jgi:TPR repeat protein